MSIKDKCNYSRLLYLYIIPIMRQIRKNNIENKGLALEKELYIDKPAKIFVVDDEPLVLNAISKNLEKNEILKSQRTTLFALTKLADVRDCETGEHLERICIIMNIGTAQAIRKA